MLQYKNKQLVARKPDGEILAYIGIIDGDALKTEEVLSKQAGMERSVETYNQQYETKAEKDAARIRRLMKGEGNA